MAGFNVEDLKNFFSASTAKPVQQQANGGSVLENNGNPAIHQQTQANATVTDNANPAPLAAFDKLWETTVNKDGAKPTGVLPAITAEQLSDTLKDSNFLANADPALMAKAAAGDANAFQSIINDGLKQVMVQSVLASKGLIEAGARTHGEQLRADLPSMVRSSNVADSLAENPLFNHPASKPIVDGLRAQIEAKNPQASAQQIATLTKEYFNDFAKLATGDQTKAAAEKVAAGETDWFKAAGFNS